jgi:hypothetical protein
MPDFTQQRGSGHGWVFPNLDGSKAKCGGPAICQACARDQQALDAARRFGQETLAAQYPEPYAVAADLLEAMKGQLLITLINRLGGRVTIPINEVDATGGFMLHMEVDQTARTFTFTVEKKQ